MQISKDYPFKVAPYSQICQGTIAVHCMYIVQCVCFANICLTD